MSLIVGGLLGVYLVTGLAMYKKPDQTDFYKFYLSSVRLINSQSMYWHSPEEEMLDRNCAGLAELKPNPDQINSMRARQLVSLVQDPCLHPNLNPPFVGVLMKPFGYLDAGHAWAVWTVLSLVCLMIALGFAWLEGVEHKVWYSTIGFLVTVFIYYPTFVNYWYAQMAFFVLLPIVMSWRALRNGKESESGVWLGLAISLKPFVGLLLVMHVLGRRWKIIFYCASVGIISFMLGGLALGFHSYLEYIEALNSINWHTASWNASINGFFMRLFGGGGNAPWMDFPSLAKGLIAMSWISVIAALVSVNSKTRHADPVLRVDGLYAVTLPAMLLLSPLGWIYYFPLLLLVGLLLWRISSGLAERGYHRGLFIIALGLTGVPVGLVKQKEMHEPVRLLSDGSYYFYCLLVMFLVAILIVQRRVDDGSISARS